MVGSKITGKSRTTGSQKEVPTLRFEKHDVAIVNGYQKFRIFGASRTIDLNQTNYRNKFEYIGQLFENLKVYTNSIADIGCSNGLICFLAALKGYRNIKGYDHDKECITLIRSIAQRLKYPITPIAYTFGQPIPSHDIVLGLALIHWVYSYTSNFGSIEEIIKYFANITKFALIIEWVDPSDTAIQSFHHLSANQNIQKQPYTKINFEAALSTYFKHVKPILTVTSTRILYIAYKDDHPSWDSIHIVKKLGKIRKGRRIRRVSRRFVRVGRLGRRFVRLGRFGRFVKPKRVIRGGGGGGTKNRTKKAKNRTKNRTKIKIGNGMKNRKFRIIRRRINRRYLLTR